MREGDAGYSLLELTVALAIMALVVFVAAPAVASSLERMTLQSDARALALGLRAVRERAMDRQTDIALTVSGREPHVMSASDGTTIALAPGTVVRTEPAVLVTWDGRVTGALQVSRGAGTVRLVPDPLTGRFGVEAQR
jgi:prepilin-type N-terminal cleavage/methylation domain-containing protein